MRPECIWKKIHPLVFWSYCACVCTVYMCECVDVTARPGHVLFKFKQAKRGREGGKRGGVEELEECQTLDWISMNSKEVDGGKERERIQMSEVA